MTVYRTRCDTESPGDLPVGHAADGHHEDLGIEVWELLPVGGREGLCTEVAAAAEACEPLDTPWGDAAVIEALSLEAP